MEKKENKVLDRPTKTEERLPLCDFFSVMKTKHSTPLFAVS